MYHPSRGGVRGGRDQFSWDDVKGDKHRENYIGHSIKAPVGRWQKGKDLHWYVRNKYGECLTAEAKQEEIQRVKEEEEQAMRELLGLAPKRENRPYGTRLDKREAAELLKKGTSAEDLAAGYVEGERVQGLGFARAPHHSVSGNFLPKKVNDVSHEPQPERVNESLVTFQRNEASRQSDGHGSDCPGEDAGDRKIRRKEEKKRRREERKSAKQEKNRHESDSKRSRKKKRRHDSDSSD